MTLSLKESRACAEMAKLLYNFLPGSGSKSWTGHVSFQTVAADVGVANFWPGGSKEPAIATLLERTLEYERGLFEKLIIRIVRAGIKYRGKGNDPITEDEINTLNGLLLDIGFKFPDLWDPLFLSSLRTGASDRAAELVDKELAAEKIRVSEVSSKEQALMVIKTTFYELAKMEDRQAAGRYLEEVLNELFELSGLKPREPFRIVGEQIDGSFELDNEIYLVEAKWEKEPLSEQPLMVFREKIQGKSNITRGVFIALNRCTDVAMDAITRGKQPNFFIIDGYDLVNVLEGRMSLHELLRAKIRCLAEEGRLLLSASEIIQSNTQSRGGN
ncbi:MAG: hypothetical protein GXO93_05365 [FCB group bacterium]|nr:hypothetical protein [FCB group bacterium]